jgi:hypothetical protein
LPDPLWQSLIGACPTKIRLVWIKGSNGLIQLPEHAGNVEESL